MRRKMECRQVDIGNSMVKVHLLGLVVVNVNLTCTVTILGQSPSVQASP